MEVSSEETQFGEDLEPYPDQEPTSINEASEPAVRRSIRVRRRPEYYIEGASGVKDGLEEPATVKEAFSSREKDEWEKAMEMKMLSLRDNDVWELVEPPKDRKVVGIKWVFTVKTEKMVMWSVTKPGLLKDIHSKRELIMMRHFVQLSG